MAKKAARAPAKKRLPLKNNFLRPAADRPRMGKAGHFSVEDSCCKSASSVSAARVFQVSIDQVVAPQLSQAGPVAPPCVCHPSGMHFPPQNGQGSKTGPSCRPFQTAENTSANSEKPVMIALLIRVKTSKTRKNGASKTISARRHHADRI